ncbi:MAG: secretion protein F [Peptococcaceae bacterium]|nr:secretion protein F [Peptococcaceae bacterium]
MIFNIFLFGLLLAAGLFFILADLLRLPTLAAEKAMLSAGKSKKSARETLDTLLMKAAIRLSGMFRMDGYKRRRMTNTLAAAGTDMTPEVFSAYAVAKAGAVLLGVVPSLTVMPLLAPILLFLAVMIYFKAIRSADEALKAKRESVENELPRFVATLTQELKAGRDVLGMLEGYKKNAGELFAGELDVLTADMRSSSYEAALVRFEARVGSPMLSDAVRGLIGVLRGDDGAVYFQMLSHDMKQLELQRLKAEAMKIPPKVRKYSFVMLMCFLMTYLVIIGYEIVRSLGGMF